MPKTPLPFKTQDIGAFARSIRKQLQNRDNIPGHVEMLNLLAKAGGYKNFQHFRSECNPPAECNPVEIDFKRVKRAVRHFNLDGKLASWPKKYNQRVLCLWTLWSRLPSGIALSEIEVDENLILNHTFCDHTMLRRWLVDEGLLSRTPDGREYFRLENRPPHEALELIRITKRPV